MDSAEDARVHAGGVGQRGGVRRVCGGVQDHDHEEDCVPLGLSYQSCFGFNLPRGILPGNGHVDSSSRE